MLDIGVDFGSTYTTVSVYHDNEKKLEALALSQTGTPFIPSVLSKGKKRTEFGKGAKNLMGKPGVRVFKAFKMLLPEENKGLLKKRGFDEEFTPRKVAVEFLEQVLGQILRDLGEKMIDHLVVCAPETWNSTLSTVDGRSILRDICQDMEFVREVRVVSEPAAASAFFAYNYENVTHKSYDGFILLIDYGGGTLDLTLTEVLEGKAEGEKKNMEIRVRYRTGAGENMEGKVGKAGIVYMESLMLEAISGMEEFAGKDVVTDEKFFRAVDQLEAELQDSRSIVEQTFGMYPELEDLQGMDEDERNFTVIEYRGEDVLVTYEMMAKVYDREICPILGEKLDEVIAFMDRSGISYRESAAEKFKLALVGGFGNFCLVRKQIEERFQISSADSRTRNIIKNRADCERAISLGAALLAADVIGIRMTAPYSIGICVKEKDQVCLSYGLRYNQDIAFEQTYFQNSAVDGEPIVILSMQGKIDKFLLNYGEDDRAAIIAYPRKEFQDRLDHAINEYGTVVVGFSVDASGILSLHIHDYDIMEEKIVGERQVIELTSFCDLFDTQRVEKAIKQ